MKVCLASFHLEYGLTGETESVINLAQFLQNKEIDLILLTPNDNRLLSRSSITRSRAGESLRKKFINLVKMIIRLNKITSKVDVIQIQLPTPALGIFGDLVRCKGRCKKIINFEGHLVNTPIRKVIVYLPKSFLFYLVRLLVNNRLISRLFPFSADGYVVSTQYQKKELLSLGVKDEKIALIPNLTDLEKYKAQDRIIARRAYGFKDQPIITYIGHFLHYKGIETLIRAFSKVLASFPEANLVLAWSGLGSLERIKALVIKNGIFQRTILLERVEVAKLLSASDIFVAPYLFSFGTICFPNVLLEAVAVGVPIVSSDLETIAELIRDGKTGLLAPPGDALAFANRIIELLSNPDLCQEMVINQKKIMEDRLNPEKLGEKFITLYQRINSE